MADFRFLKYDVDDEGVSLEFVTNPDPGEPTNYVIRFTDAEFSAITSAANLRTAVQQKLRRKLQREGFAARLDTFIGQTVTI